MTRAKGRPGIRRRARKKGTGAGGVLWGSKPSIDDEDDDDEANDDDDNDISRKEGGRDKIPPPIVQECWCVITSVGRSGVEGLLDQRPELVPPLDYDKIFGNGVVWLPKYEERDSSWGMYDSDALGKNADSSSVARRGKAFAANSRQTRSPSVAARFSATSTSSPSSSSSSSPSVASLFASSSAPSTPLPFTSVLRTSPLPALLNTENRKKRGRRRSTAPSLDSSKPVERLMGPLGTDENDILDLDEDEDEENYVEVVLGKELNGFAFDARSVVDKGKTLSKAEGSSSRTSESNIK